MAKITKSLGLMLLVGALSSSAFADYGRGYPAQGPHRGPVVHQHGSDWVAPLLFLGFAGAILGAAASQPSAPPVTYVQPAPVYVPPAVTYVAPPVVAPAPPPAPVNVWYYCPSVGKYYPYTQYCPDGWQLVYPPQ